MNVQYCKYYAYNNINTISIFHKQYLPFLFFNLTNMANNKFMLELYIKIDLLFMILA